MRSFNDEKGAAWQVAVGKESYGSMVFLFSRMDSERVLRHALDAGNRREAEQMLRVLSEDSLRDLLRHSQPWETSSTRQTDP